MIAPRVPRGATSRLRSPTALLHFHGILRSTGGLGREARTPIVVRSGRSHQKAATMLLTLLATIVGMPLAITDTTVTFGVVKRDLTGDSIPEVLTLSGTGDTIDSLEVTFTIQSSGRTRYSRTWIAGASRRLDREGHLEAVYGVAGTRQCEDLRDAIPG